MSRPRATRTSATGPQWESAPPRAAGWRRERRAVVYHDDLLTEMMAFIGQRAADATSADPPAAYAASCRWGPPGGETRLEPWSYPMTLGQPPPTIPLWLNADLAVPLDVEKSYEQACHDLWIT